MLTLGTSYSADLDACRAMRTDLALALGQHPLCPNRLQDLVLVMTEAFTNVVRHGRPQAERISVVVERTPQGLTIELMDDGGSFENFESALVHARESGNMAEENGGMGLGLMATLAGHLSYCSNDGTNSLRVLEPIPTKERRRILLIDDDPVLRRMVTVFLEDDYQVEAHDDPRSALAQISVFRPDLIVSDISMPGMDGFQVRRETQRNPDWALTPFIFLTGLREEALERDASLLGIDDFLEKPIAKQRLLNTVERVLRRSSHLKERVQASVDQRITDALRQHPPTDTASWHIGVLDSPAGNGGGDLVLHRQTADWSTFLLLDVMGHGVPAKLFAFAYAGYLGSLLRDDTIGQQPAEILHAFSERILADQRLTETIVTCIAATCFADGRVVISTAGHPRPFLFRTGHGWRTVAVDGTIPGLGGEKPIPRTIDMDPGDALLLVTDGLGEALGRAHPEHALKSWLDDTGSPDSGFLASLDRMTSVDAQVADDRTAILLTYQGMPL